MATEDALHGADVARALCHERDRRPRDDRRDRLGDQALARVGGDGRGG